MHCRVVSLCQSEELSWKWIIPVIIAKLHWEVKAQEEEENTTSYSAHTKVLPRNFFTTVLKSYK